DGVPDFIVGKRYWSHLDDYYDPDAYGAPVLYWYRTVRNPNAPGGAEFVPELIHNRSGAGSDVLAIDLNKDGAIDIVTSTNRGTFIFWGDSKKWTSVTECDASLFQVGLRNPRGLDGGRRLRRRRIEFHH